MGKSLTTWGSQCPSEQGTSWARNPRKDTGLVALYLLLLLWGPHLLRFFGFRYILWACRSTRVEGSWHYVVGGPISFSWPSVQWLMLYRLWVVYNFYPIFSWSWASISLNSNRLAICRAGIAAVTPWGWRREVGIQFSLHHFLPNHSQFLEPFFF